MPSVETNKETISEGGFKLRTFVLIVIITSIWVNLSEVFRYFVIVLPETRSFLSMVPNVAPMSLGIFAIWAIWDTVLTILVVFSFWLVSERFGNNLRSAILAGTFAWMWLFVLFWIAVANMNLARWSFILIPLVLSWIEMVVAAMIASWLYRKWA